MPAATCALRMSWLEGFNNKPDKVAVSKTMQKRKTGPFYSSRF
jgi:hypothetical protein